MAIFYIPTYSIYIYIYIYTYPRILWKKPPGIRPRCRRCLPPWTRRVRRWTCGRSASPLRRRHLGLVDAGWPGMTWDDLASDVQIGQMSDVWDISGQSWSCMIIISGWPYEFPGATHLKRFFGTRIFDFQYLNLSLVGCTEQTDPRPGWNSFQSTSNFGSPVETVQTKPRIQKRTI